MPTPNTPQDAPSLNPKTDAVRAPLPDLGDQGAVSSPDYAAAPKKGVSLDWNNVEGIWDQIRAAKKSGDPVQWEAIVAAVRMGLKEWMADVNKWPEMAKRYMYYKSAFDNSKKPEQKQRYNDLLQKMREQMPLSVRKAAEARKPIVPVKQEGIESMLKSLEGIRQADYETYPAQVRSDLRVLEERVRERQRRMRTVLRALLEKLDGVGGLDEKGKPKLQRRPRETEQEFHFRVKSSGEKLKTFMDRRDQLLKDKSHLEHELAIAQDPQRAHAIQQRLEPIDKEWNTLAKRERGVQDPGAREELDKKIQEIEASLMDDAQIRAKLNKEAELRKYDALISLVTSVAMPIKVLHTNKTAKPSMKTPYLPAGGLKQSAHPEDEVDTIDVNIPPKLPKTPPKAEASEAYIFARLVLEGHYDEAVDFWLESFNLNSGDLVILEANGLEGLKGRVREIDLDNSFAIIDLFKNDKITESSVEVELHCARPYLQD